jgi:hypothetical protein
MVLYDTFCHFLELWPGQHDETAAALALNAKIHPCTQNFPKIAEHSTPKELKQFTDEVIFNLK